MKRASPLTQSRKGQRRFAIVVTLLIAAMLALSVKELLLDIANGAEEESAAAVAAAANAHNGNSNGNNKAAHNNGKRGGDQRMVTKKAITAPPAATPSTTTADANVVPLGADAEVVKALQSRHEADMAAKLSNDAEGAKAHAIRAFRKHLSEAVSAKKAGNAFMDAPEKAADDEPTPAPTASKYRLARPLEGQVPSDEYFKPRSGYSSWWCGGPPGDKNVLGKRLDPRHYCAIRNMCIVNGRPTLFVESTKDVEGMHSSAQSYDGLPHCVFREISSFWIRAGDNGETLEKARKRGRFEGGLTAFISSSYGQTHITHFMESLGQLFYGLNIFGYYQDHGEKGAYLKDPLSPDLTGAPENLNNYYAFNRTPFALKHAELERVLVAGAGGVAKGSFNEQFYRMLYTNRRPPGETKFAPSDYRPRVVDSIETHDDRCFDEAILIGASYDPFHKTHTPSYYRHRDWFYGLDGLSEDDWMGIEERLPGEVRPSAKAKGEIEAAQRQAAAATDDANAQPNNGKRPLRRVVMAHRSSKRTVTNARELDEWMANTLPALLPQYEWRIRSVNFGGLNNYERVHVAHWADIIIGIHGADLTNLINMRPGSAVVELNPLFFFESRFREMSHSLQLHYYAWTCTRPSCSSVWSNVVAGVGDFTHDAKTGRLKFRDGLGASLSGGQREKFLVHEERHRSTGGWFKWPTDRYPGDECLGCDLMTCCTRMQSTLYGTQRESDVTFRGEEEFAEMLALLRRAAASVGTPYLHVPKLSYADQLAAAKAENARRSGGEGAMKEKEERAVAGQKGRGRSSARPVAVPQIEERE